MAEKNPNPNLLKDAVQQDASGTLASDSDIVEAWLYAREEHFRSFLSTISEAIWCYELRTPLEAMAEADAQVGRLYQDSILVECNPAFQAMINMPAAASLHGMAMAALMPRDAPWVRLLDLFVRSGFRLEQELVSTNDVGERRRYFLVNMTGTQSEGQLVRYWGSAMEVTEAHELKQHMVTLLEAQLQRIVRDLHDGVGQLLTGIRMMSERLADRLLLAESPLASQGERVAVLVQEAAEQLRGVYQGLAPVQLYDHGLQAALRTLVTRVNDYPDVRCTLHTDDVDVTEVGRAVHLYRIAQEAVNNAIKHGRADHIVLSLERVGAVARLEVRDDGKGFDLENQDQGGLGLGSMRYRATVLGGRLGITSLPGQGTIVRCHFEIDIAA